MFALIKKTIGSFRHAAIWKYVILSLFVAMVGFYGFYEIISSALDKVQFFETGWLESIVDFIARVGTVILALVLFPSVTLAIVSIFEESISKVIEEKEYKILENATPLTVIQEIKLILRNVIWNIVLLPIFFIPVIGYLLYIPINSYLLGNTVFRFIAARHVGAKQAKALAEENNSKVILAGLVLLILTNIPVLNFLAPVCAIILMVHLAHKILGKA